MYIHIYVYSYIYIYTHTYIAQAGALAETLSVCVSVCVCVCVCIAQVAALAEKLWQKSSAYGPGGHGFFFVVFCCFLSCGKSPVLTDPVATGFFLLKKTTLHVVHTLYFFII